MNDVTSYIIWWGAICGIGLIAYPWTAQLFSSFVDKGYAYAKVAGIAVFTYTIWILSSAHLLPFSRLSLLLLIAICGIISAWQWMYKKQTIPWFWVITEEILFASILAFWAYVRAHEPSINSLEKFMDFGFMNSILRTSYFPPLDMWLAQSPDYPGGQYINYYYYGHYIAAFLTKLTNLEPGVTYNLMMATLGAWTCSLPYSLAVNVWHLSVGQRATTIKKHVLHLVAIGCIAGFLVGFGGNLHTIYTLTTMYPNHEEPIPFWRLPWGWHPESYWYPDATRFIPNTIHEFPIYSFVVADLHGHVSDIPFVFLTLAILLALIHTKKQKEDITSGDDMLSRISKEFQKRTAISIHTVLILGILLAIMYMTNAWDGLIYMILAGLVFLWVSFSRVHKETVRAHIIGTIFASLVLCCTFLAANFPFSYHFKPFVSGIGVICPPNALFGTITPAAGQTEDSIALSEGPFLFEKNHCLRSPLYMLAVLWGFFLFNAIAFLIIIISPLLKRDYRIKPTASAFTRISTGILTLSSLPPSDAFVLIVSAISALLVIFPEFFYMKDIYPTHYRANTMFKLGYQAFMMMGVVSAYVLFRIKHTAWVKKMSKMTYLLLFLPLFTLVAIYPYFAIRSYYDNLRTYKGLNGMTWMRDQYPDDYQAVLWLREHAGCPKAATECDNQPVIAEANGDSYTNYDRVSANTGLPTIVGWPVHEWLWRGSYDEPGRRIPEVETLYTAKDTSQMQAIIDKYHITYIFVGSLEKEKYKELNETGIASLAKPVFTSGGTIVYRVTGK